jgi:transposase
MNQQKDITIDKNLTKILDLPESNVVNWTTFENTICLDIQFNNKEIKCPHCHSTITEFHQNRPNLIRDLSVFGKAVYLKVPRRRFYCRKCQRYSTERLDWLDWKRRHTQRYEANIFERIKGASIEKIAAEEGLSFDEVEGIFKHICEAQVKKNWLPVKRISLDEIAMRKGHKSFKTVVSDLERRKLIEVIDGHNQESIVEKLMEQPLEIREMVEEVSIDMWGGFAKILPQIFPKAQIVTDRFHVMKPLIKELKTIANQVGIRGWKKLALILRNQEQLNEQELEELEQLLKLSKRLRKAHNYKEEFRLIYEESKTVEAGKEKFTEWLKKAACIYSQVIQTIQNHLDTICNYFLSRTSSGVMEGINNKIKQIKRQAYGFTNFDNFRLRLLACFID